MSQYDTPLFTGLLAHASRNPTQFHIPGHKKGAAMAPEFRKFVGDNALSIDLINIGPLDDLHHPHGIIKEAQELAAEAFGADYTLFSVQGTSGAIMTMILASVGPGDKIILPRNVHKSIMSAVVLSGATPVFMQPDLDPVLGIAHGVSAQEAFNALDNHPDAKAILLINPTYFGVATDLKTIVEYAHSRDVAVLVDEAHGAHIHFHDQLPLSAMQAGADMAATSIHKLGGSLTQSSILNVRMGLTNTYRAQAMFSLLHTTSTSYLLLASLDVARKQLATRGYDLISQAIELANDARRKINEIPGLYCFGAEIIGKTSARFDYDPTKLTISVKDLGLTGNEVEEILRAEFNIEIELSDLYNILCIISFGDSVENVDHLIYALTEISRRFYATRPAKAVRVVPPVSPSLAMLPRDAFYAPTESICLTEAEGRISAEFIMVYPPGIPVVIPGEVLSREAINYVVEHQEAGLPVQGPEDPTNQMVKVVASR